MLIGIETGLKCFSKLKECGGSVWADLKLF